MGAAVGAVLIKERHIVEALERIGATNAANARTLAELEGAGVDAHGMAWRALRDRVIVREAEPGRYYVDSEVWQSTRRRRRRVAVVLVTLVVIGSITLFVTTGHFLPR